MLDEEKVDSSSMEQWIGRIPSLIGLASITALVTSIVHEWGYFYTVGNHFQTLLTPADYLSSALLWLPFNAILIVVSFSLGLPGADRLSKWVVTESSKLSKWEDVRFLLVTVPLLLVIFWLALQLGTVGSLVIISCLILLLFLLFLWKPTKPKRAIFIVGSILIFGLAIFTIGELEGSWDLRSFSPVYRIFMKDQTDARHIVLLRFLDKGILLHDPRSSQVEFVKWENVKSAAHIGQQSRPNSPANLSVV